MESKRRLPLLQGANEADADPARPGWQWVGLGTIAVFVVWLPLSAAAGALASRLPLHAGDAGGSARLAVAFAVASALALGVAALAGGFVVGKWGRPRVGVREASLAGLTASLVAIAASWASFGFALGAVLIIPIAVPMSALGGWLGRRGT